MSETLVTETRLLRLALPPEGMSFEKGGVLHEIHVAYETCGTLSPARDNVIFICHALTGDAHVAGVHRNLRAAKGWWHDMICDGGGIDTSRYFVICANILGGCMGTTGPATIDPATGIPYGSQFPEITVGDIVDVHHRFLTQLGFNHVYAIIGGSFGGMQTLEFGVRYPGFAEKIVCIASGPSLNPQAIGFDEIGITSIQNDPNFCGGDYYGKPYPQEGLSNARKIAHITYLSRESMSSKFGRRRREEPQNEAKDTFQVASYLKHQGDKFIRRFDANSYLRITSAMDHYELYRGYFEKTDDGREKTDEAAVQAALVKSLSRMQSRALIVALSGDWLFHPDQSESIASALLASGKEVSLFCLDSNYGHDAFLTESAKLKNVICGFLKNVPLRPESGKDEDQIRDYGELSRLLPADTHSVLDLACGRGELLNFLSTERGNLHCTGVDISKDSAADVLAAGHCAILADIDSGLSLIPDNTCDCAILSESLQVMRRPDRVLKELLRIAPVGIVSFPNFGMWSIIVSLLFRGRMPVTKRLPYEWFNTPNIHLCTIRDFLDLCKKEKIRVDCVRFMSTLVLSRILNFLGAKNLGSSRVLVRIHR